VYRDVQTYLQERMREVLSSGGHSALVVRLYGGNLERLRDEAALLARDIEHISGVAHARPEAQVLVPQIEIAPDLARCAALGIDPAAVRTRVSTLLNGERVGQIVSGQQPVDVVVWANERARDDLTTLADLALQLDERTLVRLGDIASIRVAPMQNAIVHDSSSRKMDVSVDISPNADLGRVSSEVQRRVREFKLAEGHHVRLLGEAQARAAAQTELGFAAAAALLGVALVLYADFRSLRLAGLVLTSLPLALIGGVLSVGWTGNTVSLGTLIGFVTVLGITARNGIMLISHYRQLEEREGAAFGLELVLRGAAERLVPIAMTACATGLALLPLVVRGNLPGHEIEQPMAVVILGGLVSSTILNLFVMPAAYLRFGRRDRTVF